MERPQEIRGAVERLQGTSGETPGDQGSSGETPGDQWRDSRANLFIVHYTCLHTPCLVAIVDCTHVVSATASFRLGNSFPGVGSL